ncbi:hypothetical protein OB2597_15610 [Pseudooceanicola batsensis HTCC2597]|uniref:Uncharacterized protein n=1 Tax=Pseudooceanicola batsensis (strain ATCC BAA-863 / DSM 15984 / KCTC 12145 / HTCC2597) TaxID=252305 RepID=A3TZ04_PSEBH|nr:hypothetical protein [Pseudooceanicola batsensis]EAQ02822.1 hypothetical protein OB2597_15610 [Pseudooceanicola batsensis HTCC2597]
MKDGFAHFDRRLERLEDRRAALEEGSRLELDDTGLMKLMPSGTRRRQIGRAMPVRAMLIIAGVLLTFKGFLLYQLGFAKYSAKVAAMADGDMMDRLGAKVMQIEPVTLWVYNAISFIVG